MSCDTCPEFWRHTLKPADSLNMEADVYTYGKTDTIVKNGDTAFKIPQLVMTVDPADLDRVRELHFTFTATGNILMDDKVYRRRKKKS